MTITVSTEYVLDALALQAYPISRDGAAAIAAGLGPQLMRATAAYDVLRFEDEPSGFTAALTGAR